MQNIAYDRPARLLECFRLAEYPVIIEVSDGTVLLLEFDPGTDKLGHGLVVRCHGIGQRYIDNIRFRDGDGVIRIDQAPGRAPLESKGIKRVRFDWSDENTAYQASLTLLIPIQLSLAY